MSLPLPEQFTKYFTDHSPTDVKNLLITAESIFEAETTNLNKVKKKVCRVTENFRTSPESNYKRLTRFFTLPNKRKLVRCIMILVCSMLDSKEKIKYLALDGTSWKLGEKKIHLITLSIVYHGVSIPIWWEELGKSGISNFKERKKVIMQASKIFNLKGLILLADREYIGREWFKYLKNKGIDFVIRLKRKIYRDEIDQACHSKTILNTCQQARYSKLEHIAKHRRYVKNGVSKKFKLLGKTYTFVVYKNPKQNAKEELLYFISSLEDKKQIIASYPIRWTIECCFKHLKSNGFRLEAINMKDAEKIMLMMGIVVFLYTLCILEGIKKLKKSKASDYKTFKDGKIFLTVSVFKKGLDYLNLKFNNLKTFIQFIKTTLGHEKMLFSQNVQ